MAANPFPIERTVPRRTRLSTVAAVVVEAVALVFLGREGLVWAAFFSVLLIVTVLASIAVIRHRLVIDSTGIRRRSLVGTEEIGWDEVESVTAGTGNEGSVLIGRRTGMPVLVSGLPVVPAGGEPGRDDDVVAAIRRLAGLGAGGDDVAGEPAGETVVRPSRRALLWVVPALAVSLGLTFVRTTYAGFGSVAMTFLGLGLTVFHARLLLIMCFGRTEANAAGLRNRLVLQKQVPWRGIGRLEVMPTPFGHRVVAVASGVRIGLAAPRDTPFGRLPGFGKAVDAVAAHAGLPVIVRPGWVRLRYPAVVLLFTAAMVWGEGPRLEPWWPSRHEATSVHDACAVAHSGTARGLLTGAVERVKDEERDLHFYRQSSCGWRATRNTVLNFGLEYRMYVRDGDTGGTEAATRAMKGGLLADARPLAGIGDQAAVRFTPDHRRGGRLLIRARQANVIVELDYYEQGSEAQMTREATSVVRRALDRVTLT